VTDLETIEAARRLFAHDTPGDKLGRRLLAIAEREHRETQELRNLLSPLRDAVLFARSQRRPMGIGQDFPRAPACGRRASRGRSGVVGIVARAVVFSDCARLDCRCDAGEVLAFREMA
jgi:hypothetical protein